MTTNAIEYAGSFVELLQMSENENPTTTKADVFRLPNTTQLQERYCMTFSGPEASVLAARMTQLLDALAAQAASRKPG